MRILTDLESYPRESGPPLFLALGNFDGVHRGHQALLKNTAESAKKADGAAAVFSFQEHPHRILHPEKKTSLLTSLEHRLFLLEESGMDLCFLPAFTEAFSRIEAEAFVRDILVKHLGVCEVLMGYNARFGHGRKGDAVLMKKLAREFGFRFQEIGKVTVQGEEVSSSRIRELLKKGDLDTAQLCLGRPYSVWGEVVKGEARGRDLGFPTANLKSQTEPLIPEGVYAVRVREILLGQGKKAGPWREGALNYGLRPTFGEGCRSPVLEVFILDFREELYGKTFEAAFLHKIRDEKSFSSPEALKDQIGRDVEDCRRFFASSK